MKIKPIILGILVVFYACSSKNVQPSEKTQVQHNGVPDYINVTKDYIEIDLPTKRSPVNYSIITDSVFISCPGFNKGTRPLFSIEKSRLLIATSKSDRAYILNLDSMKVEKEYPIKQDLDLNRNPEEAPCECTYDLLVDLQGLDFYTNNNIILQVNFKLLIVNSSGIIVDSIPLKDTKNPPKFIYANISDVPVEYNSSTGKIYAYKYCYDCKSGSMDYYSHPFEVSIDPDSKKISDENVRYPEIYSLFGLIPVDYVYRTSYENFQYFTFFPDHRVYIYNILNHKITVHGGLSEYSSGKIWTANKLEKDFEKMQEKMRGDDLYFPVVYDNINSRYYRLFIHPYQFDTVANEIRFEYYIQIFNKDFSLEDEIRFEKGFGAYYFSYGGKLYWIVLKKDGMMLYAYTFNPSL
jgi:hypothetical protein